MLATVHNLSEILEKCDRKVLSLKRGMGGGLYGTTFENYYDRRKPL